MYCVLTTIRKDLGGGLKRALVWGALGANAGDTYLAHENEHLGNTLRERKVV